MEARLAKCCVLIHCQVCKCVVNVASKLHTTVVLNENCESDTGLFIGISEAVIVEVTSSCHVLYFLNTYFTKIMSAQGDISGSHAASALYF